MAESAPFRGQQAAATSKPGIDNDAPVDKRTLPRPTGRGHIEARRLGPRILPSLTFRGQQAAATLKLGHARACDEVDPPSAANRPRPH